MGFLGILEIKAHQHAPGTVVLREEATPTRDESVTTVALKHGTGKDAHIILAPQPSDDPNDPLNWSPMKKRIIMYIIGLGAILYAAVFGPLMNAGLFVIAAELNVPLAKITLLSGYQLLVAGAAGPIVNAVSRKWGKRPLFLFSSVMALIGTICGSVAHDYNTLMAARIIQGFSTTAYESLAITVIGDLYFVHQRGVYTAAFQFLLGTVSSFASVIAGPITANLGWKYLFHILNAFVAVQLIGQVFFCPETSYVRGRQYETDLVPIEELSTGAESETADGGEAGLEKPNSNKVEVIRTQTHHTLPPKKTFWQETAIITGTYSHENFWGLVVAPFAVCLNLAVVWVVIIAGFLFSTVVAQAYVMAQIFSAPPYLLTASGVGYLSLGPFLGGIIGSVFLGLTIDPMIRWASKRNNGVYEPEYRLLGMIPSLVTGAGLMAFGIMVEKGMSYYATATVHAIAMFGTTSAAIASAAYALDAYRDMSNEIFIMSMMIKNFLFYGYSYFVNDWTAKAGPAEVFYVFGGVSIGLILTTPAVFVYGLRYRAFWHRHNLLEKFGIKTHPEI